MNPASSSSTAPSAAARRFHCEIEGKGATNGVLFRDAAAIENLRKIDTLIVDKTGTLTEGRPTFERAVATKDLKEGEVLRLVASLDQGSEHPLAAAIVAAANEKGLKLSKPEQFDSESGIGVRGTVDGKSLALGNSALMEQLGVSVDSLKSQAEELRGQGASVMHLAVDGTLAGLLAVSDPIKATTADALKSLRDAGLRVVMAIGDGLTTARALGKRLGIDEVHGEVTPADKLKLVEKLQAELFPLTGWLLSPLIAALAMSLSSASVIGNALRLRNAKLIGD